MTCNARSLSAVTALGLAGQSGPAAAHSFGQIYTLPVPFWLYAWAAVAVLVLSFVITGLFLSHDPVAPTVVAPSRPARWRQLPCGLVAALRGAGVLTLLLCIATGLWGTVSVYANFNMTFFWVIFGLGFTYLTALIGDVYSVVNPWRALGEILGKVFPAYARRRFTYPERAGYWPAILLYGGFVWLELFGRTTPYSLSLALIAYTAINLVAIGLVGAVSWFRYGEMFSVLLGLIARMAPVEFASGADGEPRAQFRLRRPFTGLLDRPPGNFSLLLFGLLVLSSTAFDGLHEARPWVQLFWSRLYPEVLDPVFGYTLFNGAPALMKIYRYWQIGGLLVSPWLYLACYLFAIYLMNLLTARRAGVRELALRFFPSLLPIALAYHVTHYYTLLETQGLRILPLASDPFGYGWNLFGTANWIRDTIVPDLTVVWHSQVALILLGHVVGVAVAHLEALRLFRDRRTAILSQLPMLALMIAFTVAGLWILSLPFDPGPVRYGG